MQFHYFPHETFQGFFISLPFFIQPQFVRESSSILGIHELIEMPFANVHYKFALNTAQYFRLTSLDLTL